jgi:hypothetical protein
MGGQEFCGHDFAFWWFDETVGNEDVLNIQMKQLRRRGGYMNPYINPIYTWENFPKVQNYDTPKFKDKYSRVPKDVLQPTWDYYKNYVAQSYDGGYPIVEQWYYGKHPQMCMASTPWQDYVLYWTQRYAEKGLVTGVQWDQIGAFAGKSCVNFSHGHQHNGIWPYGTTEMARRVFEDPKFKVSDPDFFIWVEGVADAPGQYVQLHHGGFDAWYTYGCPEIFQYTFPEYLAGVDPFGSNIATGAQGKDAIIRLRRCVENNYLWRQKFLTMDGGRWLKMRKTSYLTNAIKGVYWYSRFKDDLGCVVPENVRVKVLEFNPEICPYVGEKGYVITYVDVRKDKKEYQVKLSKKTYDLTNVKNVYWYPIHMKGLAEQIKFDNTDPEYLVITVPADNELNLYTRDEAYCDADDTLSTVGAIIVAKQDIRPIKVVAPLNNSIRTELVVSVVEQKIVGDEKTVNADQVNVPVSGTPERVKVAGKECYRINQSTNPGYVYFKTDDKSVKNTESVIEIKVEYYDSGTGTFRVQYNSADIYALPDSFWTIDQNNKNAGIIYRRNTNTWKTVTLLVDDALLSGNTGKECDLRVDAQNSELCIASVVVIKKKLELVPVPNATVKIGNDIRTTGADGVLKYKFNELDPLGLYVINAYKDGKDGYLPTSRLFKLLE